EGAGETRETKRCASRSPPGGAARGRGPRAARGRVWPPPSTAVRQDPTPPLEQAGPPFRNSCRLGRGKTPERASARLDFVSSRPLVRSESPAPLTTEAGGTDGLCLSRPCDSRFSLGPPPAARAYWTRRCSGLRGLQISSVEFLLINRFGGSIWGQQEKQV
ncbi:unnamed protein product, partial [Gulo gulo]